MVQISPKFVSAFQHACFVIFVHFVLEGSCKVQGLVVPVFMPVSR